MALSGEATMQLWHRLRRWRSETREKAQDHEPKLNAFETFLHLRPWQRIACVVACAVAYVLCIQSTLMANVGPHVVAGELKEAAGLGCFVVLLTLAPVLIQEARNPVSKLGLCFMAAFVAMATFSNACTVQKAGNETRRDGPRQRADRIARLDAEITSAATAYQQVPAHDYVLAMSVRTAEAALDALTKSATEECSTGVTKWKRGPRCGELEKKRDAKAVEVEKLQHNADLTERAMTIEAALGQLRRDRKALGAASEITGNEIERFPALLADFGAPMWFAKALSDHTPETDSIGMELVAMFGAPAAVMLVFKLFALLACSKTEAEKRVLEVAKVVAADHAARAAEAVSQNEAPAPEPSKAEPDHAAALGIEGEDLPAFTESPRNGYEAMAAASLKADKTRKPRRAPKLTPSHDSSVVLWAKERTFPCPGRHLWSDVATPDYRAWCEDRNLEPVSPQRFGIVMRREVLTDKENGAERKGGKTKYLGLGLNAAGLKVVAGGRA